MERELIMQSTHPRTAREHDTIEKMIHLYCEEVHGTAANMLCQDCTALAHYAFERLRRCPFQEKKPTCAKCTVHCYQPAMREKIRQTMRYAGPRMLRRHPLLAIIHLADGLRRPPVRKQRNK